MIGIAAATLAALLRHSFLPRSQESPDSPAKYNQSSSKSPSHNIPVTGNAIYKLQSLTAKGDPSTHRAIAYHTPSPTAPADPVGIRKYPLAPFQRSGEAQLQPRRVPAQIATADGITTGEVRRPQAMVPQANTPQPGQELNIDASSDPAIGTMHCTKSGGEGAANNSPNPTSPEQSTRIEGHIANDQPVEQTQVGIISARVHPTHFASDSRASQSLETEDQPIDTKQLITSELPLTTEKLENDPCPQKQPAGKN